MSYRPSFGYWRHLFTVNDGDKYYFPGLGPKTSIGNDLRASGTLCDENDTLSLVIPVQSLTSFIYHHSLLVTTAHDLTTLVTTHDHFCNVKQFQPNSNSSPAFNSIYSCLFSAFAMPVSYPRICRNFPDARSITFISPKRRICRLAWCF